MIPKKKQCCENCKGFNFGHAPWLEGECRLHPPTSDGWPRVFGSAWCLEFTPKYVEENRTRAKRKRGPKQ